MGHHWTDYYSDEYLNERDRKIQRHVRANGMGYEHLEFTSNDRVEAKMCPQCGVVVAIAGIDLHEEFHQQVYHALASVTPNVSGTRPDGFHDTGEEGPPF